MILILEEPNFIDRDGNEYYSVEVNGRSTFGDYPLWVEMINWANDQFGGDHNRWSVSTKRFFFRDRQDLEWFLLRWA